MAEETQCAHRLLGDQADHRVEPGVGDGADVRAVEQHAARVRLVEALEEVEDGGLAWVVRLKISGGGGGCGRGWRYR